MDKNAALGKVLCGGLMPVVVADRLPAMRCVDQVQEAGLEAVEVSCRHPEALALIRRIKERHPDLTVGAASLIEDGKYRRALTASGRCLPSIAEAVEAGADCLVSLLPFRESTYARYAATHVIIPGVATPGEAHQALDWGANLVKFSNPHLFGGPAFFTGMDAATHRGFPFFTTGGMRPEVIPDYVQAQVLVFAAGFDIILGDLYDEMTRGFDPAGLHAALTEYVASIREARRRYQPGVPFDGKDPAAIASASGRCLNVG